MSGLRDDYPFPLDTDSDDDPEIVGALGGGKTSVYMEARRYAVEGLAPEDFDVDPVDEEFHINAELDGLCAAVTAAGETMVSPGPWRGMSLFDGDDVCVQAAQLGVLINKLAVPLSGVEEALLKAGINARRRTDPRGTAREVRWREFVDEIGTLALDTSPAFGDDKRRAALTQMAGLVQVALGRLDMEAAREREDNELDERVAAAERAAGQAEPASLVSPVITKDNLHDVAGWARCVLPPTATVTPIDEGVEGVAVSIAVVIDPASGGTMRAWAGDVLYVQDGQVGVAPGTGPHLRSL
jgi:hypothetical protein